MSTVHVQDSATPATPGRLKQMALFLVSPFIALWYAAIMPGKVLQLARRDLKASHENKQ